MVFNATFNNISFISWRSVLLLEEIWVPRENHRLVASHWQTLSRNVVSSIPRHQREVHFKQDIYTNQGRIQDFKLGGAHLKKLRRAEGGAKIFGVFRVKNHDFTPKNHIFPILGGGGGGAKFLGYFMWKITILRQKNHIFTNFKGGARRVRPPPLNPPLLMHINNEENNVKIQDFLCTTDAHFC